MGVRDLDLRDLVTRYSIKLCLANTLQYLESSLPTLSFAMLDTSRASFHVVKNNLCYKDMHKIWIC